MSDVRYTNLIVTCEACGSVKKFTIANRKNADELFSKFLCENGCNRNLYSFITLGMLDPSSLRNKEVEPHS